MFARNISLRLKSNALAEFTQTFEKEVVPMLRRWMGFQDAIAFAIPGGTDVIAISLWDSKEHAEAYNTAGYPEVLKKLGKVLDGTPKVRVSDVISSQFTTRRRLLPPNLSIGSRRRKPPLQSTSCGRVLWQKFKSARFSLRIVL